MGLEALMFNKPAITFGRPFYDASGLTYPVSDFRDLPTIFCRVLDHYQPDNERLMAWMAATLASTTKGRLGYERVTPADAFSRENVSELSRALYEELINCVTQCPDIATVT
jgi:hypothetical protein